jgi:hypothetical protein
LFLFRAGEDMSAEMVMVSASSPDEALRAAYASSVAGCVL